MPENPRPERQAAVLAARGLVKTFGTTRALAGVDLEVRPGEVLGLVGANGAGKSTLIKILSGVLSPDAGHLEVGGERTRLDGARRAAAAGIETVHQAVDQALVAELSVAENLVLDRLAAGRLGVLPARRRIRSEAATLLAAGGPDLLERSGLDLDARVSRLSTSQRQQVLVARALAARPRVLILDEPTAALSVTEQTQLHARVRALTASGTAVVFISHHLGEVAGLCDRVVALRDGRVTADLAAPVDPARLAGAMLGDLAAAPPGTPRRVSGQPVLEATGVRARAHTAPIDLTVRSGEVVGITGLLGAGKSELLTQLVGAAPLHGGQITVSGEPFRPRHPADAVAAGIGFVPEDRAMAEVPGWSVQANLTLPDLRRYRRRGLLSPAAERKAARRAVQDLAIVCSGPQAPITSLSGGNRQKVVVARWRAAGSRLLVLDEPFRGVDIGARGDIAALLRSGAVEAALVASGDPEEIVEVADRIIVMAYGAVVGEVTPDDVDAEALAQLMTTSQEAAS